MTFSTVLIATRGEIAVRAIRACSAAGIGTVAAVSDVDRSSLASQLAGRSVCIGGSPPAQSYLNRQAIVHTALEVGADAVYPGYGFLAENADFAALCEANDITFIGPASGAIRVMGQKVSAREVAQRCGLPLVAGSTVLSSVDEGARRAASIGYPVLLKAVAGGGGRGIRLVEHARDFAATFETAAKEALAAFGSAELYLEQYIARARHVEIQILGDRHGDVIHLGDRDCSLQRRHQKVIEEAPALFVPAATRQAMAEGAVELARAIGYSNAGTVEFIVDEDDGRFAFLEMNTRIQVEHPVTEAVTGIDLVRAQIDIAQGERLRWKQDDITFSGHSVECRLTAESPFTLLPSPGRIDRWVPPAGEGVRVDTHCFEGYVVPPFYDSLLAKLVVWGNDRPTAIERAREALVAFDVSGPDTSIPFLLHVLEQPDYVTGNVTTTWLDPQLLDFASAARQGAGGE